MSKTRKKRTVTKKRSVTKKNVIVLNDWIKMKDAEKSDDSSFINSSIDESDFNISDNSDVNITTKKITANKNVSKTFNIGDKQIIVLQDKNNLYWYKGKDICILLGYSDSATNQMIIRYVTQCHKKTYTELINSKLIGTLSSKEKNKIHHQTMFVNNSGLHDLIKHKGDPEAMAVWDKITSEIIPDLFPIGFHDLNQDDIIKLNQSFYPENMLSDWGNVNCVYLAYIGTIAGIHYLKFGISHNFPRRELKEHRNFFETFNIINIWKCVSNEDAETKLKTNFDSNGILKTLSIKGKKGKINTLRELVELNSVNGLDYCLNMIELVIQNTVSPREQELLDKIKDLEFENKIKDLEHKIESYQNKCESYQKDITNLQNMNNTLQKSIDKLEVSNDKLEVSNDTLQDINNTLKDTIKKLKKKYIKK